MVTLDASRLNIKDYNLDFVLDAVRLQNTVEDFIAIVRADPSYVNANAELINCFCILIDDDRNFPHAAMMFPELRQSKAEAFTQNCVMKKILQAPGIRRRLPRPPLTFTSRSLNERMLQENSGFS